MTEMTIERKPARRTKPGRARVAVAQALIPAIPPLSGSQYLGDEHAHRLWQAGRLVRWRISTALDIGEHYGPEVDWACGVEEPAVDLWEAGTLYPSWVELCRLAELTDFPLPFFFQPGNPIRWSDTTLRFHPGGRRPRRGQRIPDPEPEPPTVHTFTAEAIADAVRDEILGAA